MISGQRARIRRVLRLAAFDAARDADFAFAVQKRHRTHLAQIEPYRIVGLVEALDFDRDLRILRIAGRRFCPQPETMSADSPSDFLRDELDDLFEQHKAALFADPRKWIDGLELVFRHWNHSPFPTVNRLIVPEYASDSLIR